MSHRYTRHIQQNLTHPTKFWRKQDRKVGNFNQKKDMNKDKGMSDNVFIKIMNDIWAIAIDYSAKPKKKAKVFKENCFLEGKIK